MASDKDEGKEGLKKQYDGLKGRYKLPDYNLLNNEFELDSIDETSFILRAVRRKIEDRLDHFAKLLDAILQPETIISDLHEVREFDDDEKEELFETYKKIMKLRREGNLAEIKCSDIEDAKFIKDAWNEFNPIKTQMIKITEKLIESWKRETNIKEEAGYLG